MKDAIVFQIKVTKYFSVIIDFVPDVSLRSKHFLTSATFMKRMTLPMKVMIIKPSFVGYTVAKESTGGCYLTPFDSRGRVLQIDLKKF